MTAAWVPCDCCENYWCTIHKMHAHDCACPPIEGWKTSPYENRASMGTHPDHRATTSAPMIFLIWEFQNAPEELRALSRHGGDEDWLAVVNAADAWAFEELVGESGSRFGCCDVSRHPLTDGRLCFIGAHA